MIIMVKQISMDQVGLLKMDINSIQNKTRIVIQALFEGRVIKLNPMEAYPYVAMAGDYSIFLCTEDGEHFPQMTDFSFQDVVKLIEQMPDEEVSLLAMNMALQAINTKARS